MDPTEHDPTGRSAHEPGAKLDAGKPRPALVLGGFARALSAVTEVGTYGARKYTDDGWRTVPDGVERYSEAMLRHLMKEAEGERCDMDTKLLHAAHAAWNALARLELMLSGSDRAPASPWRDDRLPTKKDADSYGLVWLWSYRWHEPRKHHFQSPDVLGSMWADGNLPAPTTPPPSNVIVAKDGEVRMKPAPEAEQPVNRWRNDRPPTRKDADNHDGVWMWRWSENRAHKFHFGGAAKNFVTLGSFWADGNLPAPTTPPAQQ